jgi:hypothetical protein
VHSNVSDIERNENRVKDLPSFSAHKIILLLRLALGCRLLACSYWRQSWTRRHAPTSKSQYNLFKTPQRFFSTISYHSLLYVLLSVYQAIGSMVIKRSRDKVMDFERENRRMCRAATPQFARTTTLKNHIIFEDGRGRSNLGTPLLRISSDRGKCNRSCMPPATNMESKAMLVQEVMVCIA